MPALRLPACACFDGRGGDPISGKVARASPSRFVPWSRGPPRRPRRPLAKQQGAPGAWCVGAVGGLALGPWGGQGAHMPRIRSTPSQSLARAPEPTRSPRLGPSGGRIIRPGHEAAVRTKLNFDAIIVSLLPGDPAGTSGHYGAPPAAHQAPHPHRSPRRSPACCHWPPPLPLARSRLAIAVEPAAAELVCVLNAPMPPAVVRGGSRCDVERARAVPGWRALACGVLEAAAAASGSRGRRGARRPTARWTSTSAARR